MTPARLIGELKALGVSLWREDGKLRYRAPAGALTPELLERLRSQREAIVAFLEEAARAQGARTQAGGAIEAANVPAVPLSFAQERLWFLHRLEDEPGAAGAAYNVCSALRMRGLLDEPALARALDELVRRHAILRTRFLESDEGAMQVAEERGARLEVADFGDRAAGEAHARAFIEAEAARAFDFERAPPVRFILARIAPREHILAAILHHLVTDGWSMGVVMRELSALYAAFAQGLPSPLAPPALQYADFAAHQRRTLTAEALAPSIGHWRARMAGAPAAIDLPLDHPRPSQQSYRGALARFEVDAATARGLRQRARECNASLFMVLVAAWAALLARYCGQPEVVLGTPVANRSSPEQEALVGVLSNYIPLRVDLAGDPSVAELVGRVRAMTLEAYAHQHVPFEKLVDALVAERSLGVPPLFQAAIVLQNLPQAPRVLAGLEVEALPIDRPTAKLDLTLLVEEREGALAAELEYCTDLFEPATAQRMARHFARMLEAFAGDARARLSGLDLLTPAERERLLHDWSGERGLRPERGLVHERFHEQAARTPGRLALAAGEERLTYAALSARVARLARHLATLGVAPEERIGVFLPRSCDLVTTLLAVLEAGGAYVPLDPGHPRERLASIVADAGVRVLVTTSALRGIAPAVAQVVCLDGDAKAIERHEAAPPARAAGANPLAYVIYTSGSTGRPKGVMVEHGSVLSLVRALQDAVYARHEGAIDVALVAATVFDASVQQIFGALLSGHALHVVDDDSRRSGERLLRLFDAHGIVLSDGTPSLLALLLDAGLGAREGSRLAQLLIGGEALPARLIERLHQQDRGGRIAVTNVYGPTECGVDVTFRTVLAGETLPAAHVPIGRPLSNARLRLLDARGEPVPEGMRGEIFVGGPCLARGYLGQAAMTARAYRCDPFAPGERLYASGDLGRWNAAGEIEFLGRGDDQVKVRGYRVELAEVRAAMLQHPGVRDAAVTVDAGGAARLIAYVVCGEPAPTVAALRDHLAALLPAYMVPSDFRVLERLPLNASGKVDRARLPRDGVAEMQQGVEYQAPREPREEALAAAWSRVLGRERVGASDHFFALGGDSIKALQVVAKLRQAGWRLELRELFLHPTLAALAAKLAPLAIQAPAVATAGPVALAPVQAAFLEDHAGPRHHFHQALLLAHRDPVDVAALDGALAALHAHHDALRLRFVQDEHGWTQACAPTGGAPATQVVDLSSAADAWQWLRAHATSLMAATDLARGPLFIAMLYRLPEGERVLLAAHHLVVDGVSWRILLEDLAAACAGQALEPVTDSYARWTGELQELAAKLPAHEREYWERIDATTATLVPVDAPHCPALQRHRGEARVALAPQLTAKLLTSAHQAYGTRMDDLLLTALARALASWAGEGPWRVLLESHGREPLREGADASRTVGWFTARYPVLLDLAGHADPGAQIRATKQMLRQVPHGGSTYEALRQATAGPRAPLPQVAFNYLGQLGRDLQAQGWRWMDEEPGEAIAPEARLAHELEIVGFVVEERLQLAIAYAQGRIAPERIARLVAALERELVLVIEHACAQGGPELTPSDIDYDGFDAQALDAFVKSL